MNAADIQSPLLKECAHSGQMDASQVHQHLQAGELDPSDFTCVQSAIARVEREIATESAIFTIETKAMLVAVHEGPVSVYDISQLEPTRLRDFELLDADRREIARAALYLGMRGLLVRVDEKRPELVSIRSGA